MYMQEGLLRVILDGGPTRIFFSNDSKLLEDDLEVLKVPLSPCIQKLNIFHDQNFLFLFILFMKIRSSLYLVEMDYHEELLKI